jgi:2-polyprenyl-3-methyl-5-hydroxy-6-metoxy-1,4-benzoquinol methylase
MRCTKARHLPLIADMISTNGTARCPICATTDVRFYCRKDAADYHGCARCGLIYQSPLPTRASMVAYADAEYEAGAYREYVAARAMKIRHFEDRIDQLQGRIPRGRLLDVGCSCGYFMEVAASHGFDVRGVEFSKSAIAAASPGIRDRIVHGSLEDLPPAERFDVISAFDLIEHVPDPFAFLAQCRERLGPSGMLALSTPDTGHVLRPLMRSRWPMLQPMQHLHLFSARALRHTLEAAGFRDVTVATAYKTLSLEYLFDQISSLNPVLSRTLGALGRLMPASVLKKYRRINIGELLATARRAT